MWPRPQFSQHDLILAWLVATLLSGAPSTLHALATGADALQATRAAGAMLIGPDASLAALIGAAAIVHPAVSGFWTWVFGQLLPRRHVALWSLLGAAAVAVLDLGLIAPRWFPAVAALPFGPQFADHLMWGACLGLTLQWRLLRRRARAG
jgi:hypothetical protein